MNKLRAVWLALKIWTPLKSVWYRLGGLDYEPGEVVPWGLAWEIAKIIHL